MADANPLDDMFQCRQSKRNYLFNLCTEPSPNGCSDDCRGPELSRTVANNKRVGSYFVKSQAISVISEPPDDESSIHLGAKVSPSVVEVKAWTEDVQMQDGEYRTMGHY